MLGLVMVDDHEYLIEGLKRYVDWQELGMCILDTAPDGEQGMEKIRALRPDIVLTDISMPVMDGMEMIRRLQAEGIRPKFVILTGHGEFGYAKEAIRYGVSEFVLKPILPQEVANVMRIVAEQCHDEARQKDRERELKRRLRESIPVLTERFMEELFDGKIRNRDELRDKSTFLDLNLGDGRYRVICVQIVNRRLSLDAKPESEQQYLKFAITSMVCETLGIHKTFVGFKENLATFLLSHVSVEEDTTPDVLMGTLELLVKNISENFCLHVAIGAGDSMCGFESIHESYNQAMDCLKYRAHFKECQVIFQRDIVHSLTAVPIIHFFDRTRLADALKMRSRDEMEYCLAQMFDVIRGDSSCRMGHVKVIATEMISVMTSTLLQMGETPPTGVTDGMTIIGQLDRLDSLSDMEAWMRMIFSQVNTQLSCKMNQRTTRIIEQMLAIVREEYMNDLSLQEIAKRIYLTPNYLGSIFSKNMNKSFTDYLAEYRIEKAVELLKTGQYLIYQVSEKVGYRDLDHFRRNFRDLMGVSPSQFRG